MTKLPEEDVADRIFEEVTAANLVDHSYGQKVRELLLSGSSKPEDWRFVIESSMAKSKDGTKSSGSKAGRRVNPPATCIEMALTSSAEPMRHRRRQARD
jgi:hypothetical protein